MEKKVLLVLTISLFIGLSSALLPLGECNVRVQARENCGWPGITETECGAMQCCFDSNVVDAPWCFKPVSISECVL